MILYKNFLLLLAKEDAAGTTNKISGYSTSNEKVKENNKSFDYEHGEVILDVRHLKQFFRFGKGAGQFL